VKRNVVVAQSGGPSPVINAFLQGIIEACGDYGERVNKVFAAWHGVEGILLEELIDLSIQSRSEIELLKNTPAAGAVGTCRYKLEENQHEDFERIVDMMLAHDVGWFFYIGGNDSMDTAHKVSRLAHERGFDLSVTGVPKTIDNDVGDQEFTYLDHTPGYGSAARYWAYITQNVNEENRGISVSEPVAVLQAMGRKAGFIPAAARLADPDRMFPIQLYLAESRHNLHTLHENVNRELAKSGRCIVIASEGFDVGGLGEARDGFGHIEYGASRTTVAQKIVTYLNEQGINARGQATGQLPGVLQRCTSIFASRVDIEEAYQVARHAVETGMREGTGWMATILREKGEPYRARYDRVALETVAGSFRTLPPHWLTEDQLDVTDDFIGYARPLIGDGWPDIAVDGRGLQRFARFKVRFIEKKLPSYVPVKHRNG
jgi:6-phosphofructokinase 1